MKKALMILALTVMPLTAQAFEDYGPPLVKIVNNTIACTTPELMAKIDAMHNEDHDAGEKFAQDAIMADMCYVFHKGQVVYLEGLPAGQAYVRIRKKGDYQKLWIATGNLSNKFVKK